MARATAIAWLVFTAACADGASPPQAQSWETLPVPVLRPASEPEIVIGDQGETPAYALSLPTGALRLSDGAVIVADSRSREVRFFSAEGDHLRTIGGEGDGPGEFRSLFGLHRASGDTLVAWDRSRSRATFIGPDGTLEAVIGMPPGGEIAPALGGGLTGLLIPQIHPMAGGPIVLEPRSEPLLGAPGRTDIVRDTLPVAIYHPGSGAIRNLGLFPSWVWFRHDRSVQTLPFSPRLSVAAGREVVYVGTRESAAIRRFTSDGEPLGPLVVPLDSRPVTPEDAAWVRERALERSAPERRDRVTDRYEAMTLPDSMPIYDLIQVDAVDRLWVRQAEGADRDPRRWMVFSSDGTLETRVTIPQGLELFDAGRDYVVVHATGRLGVDEIRLYRLEPESG